ncbi:MAG: hypothetical protein AAFX79_13095 [Planctomycetota bacterium]
MSTQQPTTISIAMLISAIFNLIWAASAVVSAVVLGVATLGIGCGCLVIPVPAIILAIYELKVHSRLTKPGPWAQHEGLVRTVAIVQVISIIFGNVVSCVCGIVALVHLDSLRD